MTKENLVQSPLHITFEEAADANVAAVVAAVADVASDDDDDDDDDSDGQLPRLQMIIDTRACCVTCHLKQEETTRCLGQLQRG